MDGWVDGLGYCHHLPVISVLKLSFYTLMGQTFT